MLEQVFLTLVGYGSPKSIMHDTEVHEGIAIIHKCIAIVRRD